MAHLQFEGTAAIVGARRAGQVDDVVAAAVQHPQLDLTEIESVPELAGSGQ